MYMYMYRYRYMYMYRYRYLYSACHTRFTAHLIIKEHTLT